MSPDAPWKCGLLIQSIWLLYSNLLATSIFIETSGSALQIKTLINSDSIVSENKPYQRALLTKTAPAKFDHQ